MDDRTRLLIEQIIEDCISDCFRNLKGGLGKFHEDEALRRMAEHREKMENPAYLPPSQYEGFSSGPWTHRAGNIFLPQAIAAIAQLGERIRECSTSSEAGQLFQTAAADLMSRLDVEYEAEFDRARPFLWDGQRLVLPIYWANKRPDLERKIKIEELKFADAAPLKTSSISDRPVDAQIQPESLTAALPSKWRRTRREDIKPYLDEMAAMVRAEQVSNLLLAAKQIMKGPNPPIRPGRSSDDEAKYLYDKAREIYYDSGYPKDL